MKKTIAEPSYKKKVFNDFDHCEFNRSEHKTKTFLVPVTAKLSITKAATTNGPTMKCLIQLIAINWIIAALLNSVTAEDRSCDFPVTNETINGTSMKVTFQMSKECRSASYLGELSVKVVHVKLLGCNDTVTDNSVPTHQMSNDLLTITNLRLFSVYEWAITGSQNVLKYLPPCSCNWYLSTPASLPQLRPRRKSDLTNVAQTDSILFEWSQPEGNDCRLRNGKPGGYK